MPRCKICKNKFEYKWSSFEKTCLDPECILEFGKKVKDKQWRAEKKILKESLKTNADYVKELQVIVNKFVRLRDAKKGCISCDTPLTGKYDAGHYYSAGGNPELRFDTDNIHGQCVWCNQHRHGALLEYTERLPKRIGEERFKQLKDLRGVPKKYSIPELIELKVIFKERTKNL